MCESKELIVGYVYGELPPDERGAFETHLAACVGCRTEIEELRATRTHLSLWAPPEPDLGFRVIRGGAAPVAADGAPALPRRRLMPAFAFAAAAVIVLAAAAAISNLEVQYRGVTVRAGWGRDAPSGPEGAVAAAGTQGQPIRTAASPEFAALERRLRDLESSMNAPQVAGAQPASATRLSDAEILRRVRQMVVDAEARQETVLAKRLLQVLRDVDYQRRADIAMIQQGLGQYQGLANAEIAQNRDMLNQLYRVATRQEK
jgi:hypothetical protein